MLFALFLMLPVGNSVEAQTIFQTAKNGGYWYTLTPPAKSASYMFNGKSTKVSLSYFKMWDSYEYDEEGELIWKGDVQVGATGISSSILMTQSEASGADIFVSADCKTYYYSGFGVLPTLSSVTFCYPEPYYDALEFINAGDWDYEEDGNPEDYLTEEHFAGVFIRGEKSEVNSLNFGQVLGVGKLVLETEGFPGGDFSDFLSSDYSIIEFGGSLNNAYITLPSRISSYPRLRLSGGNGTMVEVGNNISALTLDVTNPVTVSSNVTVSDELSVGSTIEVGENGCVMLENTDINNLIFAGGSIWGKYGMNLSEGSYEFPLNDATGSRSLNVSLVSEDEGNITFNYQLGSIASLVGSSDLQFDDSYCEVEGSFSGDFTFTFDGESSLATDLAQWKLYVWNGSTLTEASEYNSTSNTFTATVNGGTHVWFTLAKEIVEDNTKTWTGEYGDDWYAAGNWSPAGVPTAESVVTIPYLGESSNYPVIGYHSEVAKAASIEIKSGAILTVGKEAVVKGTAQIIGGGNLEVVGSTDGIFGQGDLIINHHCTDNSTYKGMCSVRADISCNVVVNRVVSGRRVWYMGSSVRSGEVASENENTTIRTLDAVSNEYEEHTAFASDMMVGNSYRYDVRGAHTITQTGRVSATNLVATSTKGLSLYDYGEGTVENPIGWNLVANPFSYSLPICEDVIKLGACEKAVSYYKLVGNEYVPQSVSLTGVSSVGDATEYLAANQGFFVKATSEGATITIDPRTVSLSASTVALKSLKVNTDVLHLEISSEGLATRSMALAFAVKASDASLPELAGADYNGIYGVKGDNLLLIAGYPALARAVAEGTTMPIAVELSKDADMWTITASDIDRFNTRYDVYLLDKANGNVVNLREAKSYTFTSDVKGQLVKDRFVVSFSKPEVDNPDDPGDETTAVETVEAQSEIAINAIGNAEVAVAAKGDADVTVYNLAGVPVKTAKVKGGNGVVAVGSKGLYVVKVATESGVASKKLLVK